MWQAFEKFVHKQVCLKNKIADTLIIGLFRKVPNESGIQFLPQPDFLEVGKFKLQKSLRGVSLVGSNEQDTARGTQLYKDSYEILLKVSSRQIAHSRFVGNED